MREMIGLILLPLLIFPAMAPAAEPGEGMPGEPVAVFDRTVALVSLRNTPPAQIRENLALLNRNWGIFPSIQFLELPVSGGGEELLFLRGRKEEVEEAVRIAEAMDRLYPPPSDPALLAPVPLVHLGGRSMREKLLSLARASGLGLDPAQFLVFPPGPNGSLFFYGSAAEAGQVQELKTELDRPRHGSPVDLFSGFYREFRNDLAAHFITVATYAASALILLCLHFLLGRLPWLGRKYRSWFTLIWTRLIHDVRGRDFAYEVIKNLAEAAAAAAVEQSSRRPLSGAASPAPPVAPETQKSRAMAIARDLLAFRGFDPDDPELIRITSDLVESAVCRLRRPGRGE